MTWKDAIKDYQYFLKIERGLSHNSISAYRRDILKLMNFLEEQHLAISPVEIGADLIERFVYTSSKTIAPRSQARMISGLRNFFDYLIFEDYRKENPTDLLETPKIGRKLPDTLSENEINQIISHNP